MDNLSKYVASKSRVFITSETVSSARMTLPLAHIASYDVMQVKVMSVDGSPAMIEFERIRTQDEGRDAGWTWEAIEGVKNFV